MPLDCIKHCQEALIHKPANNPKAYYRLHLAYKLQNDLDRAKDNLLKAIQEAPNDIAMRDEYKALLDLKNVKEKQWYKQMDGFYSKQKISKIEDEEFKHE
jgi:tetratricopeptide (TPR) repeat protein